MNASISPMTVNHWPRVREIYLAGIAGGNATFETEAPSWEDWDPKHLSFGRIVAVVADDVMGWAALSPVSNRAAYRGVAENSVYVAPDAQGRGLGRALLQTLIVESEVNGIWMVQTSIFPENVASIRLHHSCGFREVGRRERIAQLKGLWRSTVFMEKAQHNGWSKLSRRNSHALRIVHISAHFEEWSLNFSLSFLLS